MFLLSLKNTVIWIVGIIAGPVLLLNRDFIPLGHNDRPPLAVFSVLLTVGGIISALPVIVLFFFIHRHLISGMTAGAVKG